MYNRTAVYASPRRPINLGFGSRLALRIYPIIAFIFHIQVLLEAIHCQTSPRFSIMRYGDSEKHRDIDFAGDGGFLYYISSILLFRQNDLDSCSAVNMIQGKPESLHQKGSLSLLWPLFQSICIGQFFEVLSCAIQGRSSLTETGMSVFEHSLAFAESEAMISNRLGLSPFGISKAGSRNQSGDLNEMPEAAETIAKSVLFDKLNTSPEVLLIGLISSFSNLTSQILGVFKLQSRFRLINTGFWGLCFMGSFVWGVFSYPELGADAIILRFPTVCIVGFIPHLLILTCICICAGVYLLALFLSVISPPNGLPPPISLLERFQMAHQNLQATSQLSSVQLSMQDDFYSALVKVGFAVLTVASEAVYLNEGQVVNVGRLTWLEEQRFDEIEDSRQTMIADPTDFTNQVGVGIGLTGNHNSLTSDGPRVKNRGYSREKTTKLLKSGVNRNNRVRGDGVGALQRGGRYVMVWELFTGIFWLMTGAFTLALAKILDLFGIARGPQWLRHTRSVEKISQNRESIIHRGQPNYIDFWLLSDEGVLSLPENSDVDVEAETKRRIKIENDQWGEEEEQRLDSTLYGWWTNGGWWGERDGSGYYKPPQQEDDTTSIISGSIHDNEVGWVTDDEGDDGRRTPTQEQPYPRSRSCSPVLDHSLNPSKLARLLSPQNPAEREEAQILTHHLKSEQIITRSKYRHAQDFEKAHILTSTRYRPATLPSGHLTPQEEAEFLEHMIISRRAHHAATATGNNATGTWRDGAEGLGSGGPQCVVCQSSPRTVLAWPCRCLSLCEDCRVSLAMNNFGTCVCCRQEVVGFSRLFVP